MHLKERVDSCDARHHHIKETAYKDYDSFRKAVEAAYTKDAPISAVAQGLCYGNDDMATIDIAWQVYQATKNCAVSYIIGRRINGGFPDDCDQRVPSIDIKVVDNFLVINGSKTKEASGGVLDMGQQGWSFLINDAFIMGLIHHRQTVLMASPRTDENLYNSKESRTTIMLRELSAFCSSDSHYDIITDDRLGEAAKPRRREQDTLGGLSGYLGHVTEDAFELRARRSAGKRLADKLWNER